MKDNDEKLTYVVEQIGGINKTLEFQSKQLESHIKRTELLENRIIPIEDHVKFIQTLLKIGIALTPIVLAVLKILRKW